jgi:cyclophilin family peptidyl-prolyl cis-trans isomerase
VLPQLKGRATVDASVRVKDNSEISSGTLRILLDGYNAPVTAGNFVDLVQRKFYDGLSVQRADGFVVQTGDPEGSADGFVDPATNEVRRIPFEVMVRGDKAPTYYETLEEQGRPRAQPALPFNAFGTLAMARSEFETNSASSQIFWLLKEAELTPSGANILDGRYAVFGYLVDGQNILNELKVGDTIESMKVVSGSENLVNSSLNRSVGSNGNGSESTATGDEQQAGSA